MPSPRIHFQDFSLTFQYSSVLDCHVHSSFQTISQYPAMPTDPYCFPTLGLSPTSGLLWMSGFLRSNFTRSAPCNSVFNWEPLSVSYSMSGTLVRYWFFVPLISIFLRFPHFIRWFLELSFLASATYYLPFACNVPVMYWQFL